MMGVGLSSTELVISHKDDPDDYDGKPTVEERHVKGLIQSLASLEETQIGIVPASLLKIKVHVSDPIDRNVDIGDQFKYCGNTYTVVTVDDGIMKENMVQFVPFRWTFTAEVVNGSA